MVTAIISLLLMLLVGICLRRLGKMPDSWMDGLNQTVMNIALPAMVIMAFQTPATPENIKNVLWVFLWSVVCQAVMLYAGYLLTLRAKAENRNVLHFAAAFSNAGFIGFPVIRAAFPGDAGQALLYATLFVASFHLFAWTIGRRLFDKKSQMGIKGLMKNLANPTLISVAIGAVLFCAQVTLPEAIADPLRGMGALTTPLSMIVIGARLGATPVRDLLRGWDAPYGVLLRQIIAPALAMGVMVLFGFRGLPMQVVLLECAMPAAAFLAMFAERWGGNKPLAARTVALSTLTAGATIPLWLWISGFFG